MLREYKFIVYLLLSYRQDKSINLEFYTFLFLLHDLHFYTLPATQAQNLETITQIALLKNGIKRTLSHLLLQIGAEFFFTF